MRTSKLLCLVFGSLAAVLAFVLVIGGVGLFVVHGTQRDASGYYTTSTERLSTATYALTSERIDLGADVGDRWVPDVGTARIRAESTAPSAIFVGIAREADVDRYLLGSAHDELTDVTFDPFRATYVRRDGAAPPALPATQPFWVASASGPGRQTLTWHIEPGDWAVVVMNADATPVVAVDTSVGIKTGLLLALGAGLVVAGLIGAAGATVLLVFGGRREGTSPAPDGPPRSADALAPNAYPLRIRGRLDEPLSRWLWLVKWLLAVPHLVVLAFLWMAFVVLTVVAGVSILCTRRYPRAIFDFNVGVLRWTWRVAFYAVNLGTDRYPPFGLSPDDTYPADLTVDYPAELSRPLVLVKWWLLALPHYVVIAIFGGGLSWWWGGAGTGGARSVLALGLVGVLVIVAAVTLAFTSRYPRPVFDFVMGMQRWTYRVWAYAGLMTDAYPPFRLDNGGPDPGSVPPVPHAGPDPLSGEVVGGPEVLSR